MPIAMNTTLSCDSTPPDWRVALVVVMQIPFLDDGATRRNPNAPFVEVPLDGHSIHHTTALFIIILTLNMLLLVAAGEQQEIRPFFAPQQPSAAFGSWAVPLFQKAHLLGHGPHPKGRFGGAAERTG